jgi:hypothetical protein
MANNTQKKEIEVEDDISLLFSNKRYCRKIPFKNMCSVTEKLNDGIIFIRYIFN